jgi:hypothetical protein
MVPYICQGAKIFHREEQTDRRTNMQTGKTYLLVAFRNFLQRNLIGVKFITVYETAHNGSCAEPHALSPLPHTLFVE